MWYTGRKDRKYLKLTIILFQEVRREALSVSIIIKMVQDSFVCEGRPSRSNSGYAKRPMQLRSYCYAPRCVRPH